MWVTYFVYIHVNRYSWIAETKSKWLLHRQVFANSLLNRIHQVMWIFYTHQTHTYHRWHQFMPDVHWCQNGGNGVNWHIPRGKAHTYQFHENCVCQPVHRSVWSQGHQFRTPTIHLWFRCVDDTFSSNRQGMDSSSSSISTPRTHTSNSPWKTPRKMVPYSSWIPLFPWDLIIP